MCNKCKDNHTKLFHTLKKQNVQITDSYFENAFNKEISYLMCLEPDRLLSSFRETKGLEPKARRYGGWEDSEIRGHTLGHYLTAISQAYATTKDTKIGERIEYIGKELEESQLDNGYLSAFPEEAYDKVEQGKRIWVPWYTMHKIIEGIVAAYKLTGFEIYKNIGEKLGDWVANRVNGWDEKTKLRVLSLEYGGMNDCMYDLYNIVPKEAYLKAAHQFDELALFQAVHDGKDILNGLHANTTIPKFVGALNRYFTLGKAEKYYLHAAESFWEMVVKHHSYVTGGNSEWEHFGEPDILDAERTTCNCETCNVYNMLKLSKGLYQATGEKKYIDFYENALLNAILSSQNPETGMTMYFQPMATGYFKVYGHPFDNFWCCTGTGMENFTKLNDALYFRDENTIIVAEYISSIVELPDKKIRFIQKSSIPISNNVSFIIETEEKAEVKLAIKFRIPAWTKEPTVFKVNEHIIEVVAKDGWITLDQKWQNGDKVELILTAGVSFKTLPDNEAAVSFCYGPYVLSTGMGKNDMVKSKVGVDVSIATKNFSIKDYIVVKDVKEWLKALNKNLVRIDSNKLEFKLIGTDEDEHFLFTPHFARHNERYGIYFNLVEPNSSKLKKYLAEQESQDKLQKATIDSFPIGNDQYELQHNCIEKNSYNGSWEGFSFRRAEKGGFFEYSLKVEEGLPCTLIFRQRINEENQFKVLVDGIEIEKSNEFKKTNLFVAVSYDIPEALIKGKDKITVKFIPKSNEAFGVYGVMKVVRKFDLSMIKGMV
ncbi:beta-L-arabinofuranosidase domain-containing protein [Clostridium hydrogenum]|uniref:beta-L-arabinofuranosidase domain-containing protein n=1 Tax=Clostridium hydrogenum TaxID=2855764 RepID=UPI001F49247A|nr:beta-L-arabinofuranosidase domain-containing protein [Clostridium hydrogenum]